MAGTKNATRQYVAISYYELDVWTHRPRFIIILEGEPGDAKDLVEEQGLIEVGGMDTPARIYNETLRKNLFVVTLSAAKRSYKTAWNNYVESEIQAAQEQAQFRAHAGPR